MSEQLVENGWFVNDDGVVFAIINGRAYEVENAEDLADLPPGSYPDQEAAAKLARWPVRTGMESNGRRGELRRASGQRPAIVWMTGLSAAGKSTIAGLVGERLRVAGHCVAMLDGDDLRDGLCRDLGFSEEGRIENIRRAGEVARLMMGAGLIVLCSFISPYRAGRQAVRGLVPAGDFIEVFVDAPLAECMRRDPKGLYAKALPNFTGIDAPYEAPEAPELHLRTEGEEPSRSAERVLRHLSEHGIAKRIVAKRGARRIGERAAA